MGLGGGEFPHNKDGYARWKFLKEPYDKPANNSRSSDKCPVNFSFWPAKAYPGRTSWPCMSAAQISGKYGKFFIYYSAHNITKKCRVVFPFHSLLHLHQGCCLMGAGRLKCYSRSLSGLFSFLIPIQSVRWLQSSDEIGQKIIHTIN